MYDRDIIKNKVLEIQEKVDNLMKKEQVDFNKVVRSQLPKRFTFDNSMGKVFIIDENNEYKNKEGDFYAKDFADFLSIYLYNDCFLTGLDIKEED